MLFKPAAMKRTDIWVPAFDGIYRLWFSVPLTHELERKLGHTDREGIQRSLGIFAIYGSIAKGRYELEGKPIGFAVEATASIDACRETVRLGLIGGGNALVSGEQVKVTPERAKHLVETYLVPGPIEDSWNLAYLMLSTAIHGREEEPHEVGTDSRTAVFPVAAEAKLEA